MDTLTKAFPSPKVKHFATKFKLCHAWGLPWSLPLLFSTTISVLLFISLIISYFPIIILFIWAILSIISPMYNILCTFLFSPQTLLFKNNVPWVTSIQNISLATSTAAPVSAQIPQTGFLNTHWLLIRTGSIKKNDNWLNWGSCPSLYTTAAPPYFARSEWFGWADLVLLWHRIVQRRGLRALNPRPLGVRQF